MKKRIIIDTDPGVDDAIALMYALKRKELDIVLISSAGGNGPIENITSNALHLVELLGANIPVVQGATQPIKRKAGYALGAQGESGLGNYTFNRKTQAYKPVEGEACDVIYQTLKQSKRKTTIVAIGPMTNIAKLIIQHPDCLDKIEEIVFESGTKEKIYGKPYKSFNAGYDPEAAEVIFQSGVKIVMVPMELGHIAYLDKKDIARFKRTNQLGKTYAKMFDGYRDFHVGNLGAAVHDACAVYYLTHPQHFKTEQTNIQIKYYSLPSKNKEKAASSENWTSSSTTKNPSKASRKYKKLEKKTEDYGYIDTNFESANKNATICMDIDVAAFKKDLFEALEQYQ